MPACMVFLVDDDPDFLDMEKRILEAGGWQVSCFSDPREAFAALELAAGRRPAALVVTDLMMASLDLRLFSWPVMKTDPRFARIP